jgi:LemA protein
MKTKTMALIGILVLVLIVIMAGCGTYNSLVESDQGVQSAWGEVQNQYQRRADLIPNLVNTVKGYAKHEEQVLTAVVEARAKATQVTVGKDVIDDPESLRRFQEAQDQLTGALGRLIAVSEAYPDLKANQNFMMLQTDLAGTENRIAVARQRFNTTVQGYNTQVRKFPANIFAGIFGFHPRAYFQTTPGAETAPKVEF